MLNASIVLYKHSVSDIRLLVKTLQNSGLVSEIFLIDNSPNENKDFEQLNVKYIYNNSNLGYGRAHNIALRKSLAANIPYHLVVNPDISFESEILKSIVKFMDNNADVGHLMPKVFYPNGDLQYLCKLLPTPTDLIFRRFLPKKPKKVLVRLLKRAHKTVLTNCLVMSAPAPGEVLPNLPIKMTTFSEQYNYETAAPKVDRELNPNLPSQTSQSTS